MATRWTDSCDRYSSASDMDLTYEQRNSDVGIATTGGRWGGGAITLDGTAGGSLRKETMWAPDSQTENTVSLCFNMKMNGAPSATSGFIAVWGPTGSPSFSNPVGGVSCWQVFLTTSGFLEIFVFGRDQADFNGSVASFNLCDNSWHWVEITLKIGNPGLRRVDIDGANYMNNTSQSWSPGNYNAPNGFVSDFGFFNSANYPDTMYLDDIIFLDSYDQGTGDLNTLTDTPIGLTRIESLTVDAAGTNAQLTASAGSNYQCVDESPVPNDDTDYVESSTSGHTDTHSFSNITASPTTIKSVAVHNRARDSQGQGQTLRGVALSNSVEAVSESRQIEPNYKTRVFGFGEDPNTAAAWTEAGVNAAEFGYEVP